MASNTTKLEYDGTDNIRSFELPHTVVIVYIDEWTVLHMLLLGTANCITDLLYI
jgi:hypothetical protein